MRVLLTGTSGFVGSALAPRLIAQGCDLFSLCRPEAAAAVGKTVHWPADNAAVEFALPEKIDAVVHLAQSRAFRKFPADAPEMFGVNVRMAASLLQCAANAGVKQFILVSSGAVYEPFAGQLHETDAVAPGSFLGATKLAAEVLAKPYAGLFKLSVLRLFFPYGPGQRDRLIPDLIRRVQTKQAVQVTEDGEGLKFTPTFIDDAISVFVECLNKEWRGTFNVAAPEQISIRQVVDLIGKQLKIVPLYEQVSRPPVAISPDIGRLVERFDVKRFTPFEHGLRATIAAGAY